MRIALLSYEFPPATGFGGIGTYTATHARALAAAGHEVTVFAGAAEPGAASETREDGVLVRRLGDRRRRSAAGRALRALGWWWSANRLENGWRMRKLVAAAERAGAFDVVEFPDCGAEALRLPLGGARRRVARFHSPAECIMPFYDTRPGDRRLCAALERRSLRRAGRFTACSRFLAAEAERRGLGRDVAAIPNGLAIDAATVDGRQRRAALAIGDDRKMLLFSGRVEPRKGSDLLAALAPWLARRGDVVLVVAGDDLFGHVAREIAPTMVARGDAGGSSLRALGRRSPVEVRELLAAADVVWLPSRWESCPYALLEAMAAGAPTVVSRVGGVGEMVDDGVEARLAPEGDVAAHRAALESLLDDPASGRALGEGAKRRAAAEFSAVTIARRTLELYAEVAARAGER